MADINSIDKANLPERSQSFLKLNVTDNDLSTEHDDQYIIRILIDKVNELITEVNKLKNE
tara:strand:- start:4522 stop:4701 length:180 start_codon:yes stop_codon:yes gene_type:complete